MSDFEDEMDVDAPAPADSVIFSSETSKGKRSAANLPVEAEDTLPWYWRCYPVFFDIADDFQGRKIPSGISG
jgi:replication factor C subunit 3/5